MDYYADKSRSLPRFIYRNLIEALEKSGDSRAAVMAKLTESLTALKPKGDWLKMKWCMPARIGEHLSDAEKSQTEALLAERRDRRNDKFLEVFPHCSDEFSFGIDFLDAAFGSARIPLLDRKTKVITIGSCFARNIAVFLSSKGYNVTPFQQAEDLNSPFSNAKMLSICAADEATRRSYVTHWVSTLYPPELAPRYEELANNEIGRLESLASFIRESEIIIVTCGNIIDYFLAENVLPGEPGPKVAPKFFSISASEDVELRTYLTRKMREAGADFRMGTYQESVSALRSQYDSIRRLNPTAQLIYTLSPVPIDSAIGLRNTRKSGAIELDCISKSSLRVALAEFLDATETDEKLKYFPSFEIVRWIAPNVGIPVFGNEDAASRHVSQDVLNGVYRYFLHKYGVGEVTPGGQ